MRNIHCAEGHNKSIESRIAPHHLAGRGGIIPADTEKISALSGRRSTDTFNSPLKHIIFIRGIEYDSKKDFKNNDLLVPADLYGFYRRCDEKNNLKDNGNDTTLHKAASEGYIEIVKFLIKHGADVNGRGYLENSPLHKSAIYGRPEVAIFLLENGVNVNAMNKHGDTPLQEALTPGDPKYCSALGKMKVAQILRAHGGTKSAVKTIY